ncbi:site-specific DNA methylase [Rhodoplanes sp. Z2-YC6860]|nr:site-specific DNA methylase [Rhodoplanes sp. Z2-YC6860]
MFCGAGGSSAGARLAGAEIVRGIDAWDLATVTFKDNFANAVVETRELGPFSRPAADMREGEIDLLLASPECTNHSPAKGSRRRSEKSRQTSHYVATFAKMLWPRWIVLENVVQLRDWRGYASLTKELKKLGYHMRPQVLNAADFGVPQTRRRLFVICDRDREPESVKPRSRKRRPAESVIDLEGGWPSRPLYAEGRAQATIERAERAMASLGKRAPFLIVYYGSDGAGGWQSLDRPLRTLTTLDRFGLVTWDGREPMLRMLQVDELRRAMGFPNTHSFDYGTRRDRIKLLGNGVAPPVMKAIVETLAHP